MINQEQICESRALIGRKSYRVENVMGALDASGRDAGDFSLVFPRISPILTTLPSCLFAAEFMPKKKSHRHASKANLSPIVAIKFTV